LGDTGDALGDSIYEARLYVRGKPKSLGADCVAKDMGDAHKAELRKLLDAAGLGGEVDVSAFSRYGSARKLYNFHVENLGSYRCAATPSACPPRRESRRPSTGMLLPRFTAPRQPASTTFAASGRSAGSPTSMTSYSLAPRSAATRSRVIARSVAPTLPSARASPRNRSRSRYRSRLLA